jgi:hypothetical protein
VVFKSPRGGKRLPEAGRDRFGLATTGGNEGLKRFRFLVVLGAGVVVVVLEVTLEVLESGLRRVVI